MTVTVPDFGSISSIEFVGPYPFYYPLVEYLVQRGYTRDVNIRGAPYDWRLNPGMLLCLACTQTQASTCTVTYFSKLLKTVLAH